MLGRNCADGLQLDDDPSVANEVRHVGLPRRLAFVSKRERLACLERNVPRGELDRQALLVDRLQEARAMAR
jgi:hypothetical protein